MVFKAAGVFILLISSDNSSWCSTVRTARYQSCNSRLSFGFWRDYSKRKSTQRSLGFRVIELQKVSRGCWLLAPQGTRQEGFFEGWFCPASCDKTNSKVLGFSRCRGYRHRLRRKFKVVGFRFIEDQQKDSLFGFR